MTLTQFMVLIILGILLCSAALTALQVRRQNINFLNNHGVKPQTLGEMIFTFIVYVILISAIVWVLDLLLNAQVTL